MLWGIDIDCTGKIFLGHLILCSSQDERSCSCTAVFGTDILGASFLLLRNPMSSFGRENLMPMSLGTGETRRS